MSGGGAAEPGSRRFEIRSSYSIRLSFPFFMVFPRPSSTSTEYCTPLLLSASLGLSPLRPGLQMKTVKSHSPLADEPCAPAPGCQLLFRLRLPSFFFYFFFLYCSLYVVLRICSVPPSWLPSCYAHKREKISYLILEIMLLSYLTLKLKLFPICPPFKFFFPI